MAAPYQRAARHLRAPHLLRVAKASRVGLTEVRRHWAWADVLEHLIELDAESAAQAAARAEQEARHGQR